MKVPRFVTLQPSFEKNLKSKVLEEEVVRFPDIPKMGRRAAIHQRDLRHMYDVSLTNMAVCKRLLDTERDTLSWQEESAGQESRPCLPSRGSSPEKAHSIQPATPPQLFLLTSLPSTSDHSHQLHPLREKSRQTPQRVHRCKSRDPLSLDDVCQQTDVQIIYHVKRLWSNYIGNNSY